MTRREFFQIENNTWKSAALRCAYIGGKRALPYREFLLHIMVNSQTMFVKRAIMEMRHRRQPTP